MLTEPQFRFTWQTKAYAWRREFITLFSKTYQGPHCCDGQTISQLPTWMIGVIPLASAYSLLGEQVNHARSSASSSTAKVIVNSCGFRMIRMPFAHHHQRRRKRAMYRIIAALFLLVASAAASSAQGLFPSVWQSQQGALLKVLWVDPATGNFGGVFITRPAGPCPAVPADLAGRVRGPRVAFQTSRTWTLDCRVTAVWFGRFISPTTIATRWIATSVAPNGRVVRTRGTEVFQRI